MRLLVLKKIDLGHALEMLEIGYLLIMRESTSRPEVFGQATSAKFSSGEPRRSRALR